LLPPQPIVADCGVRATGVSIIQCKAQIMKA
jgi:hypothetical protein